ncbi:hypothetical protein GF323_01290 [Candidatus Woesearchaeota archaeon]|nr:hypothetical protein [Candidatus Woesearchaeota archaeon]
MNSKKGFIASSLLDLISWILFFLAAILFYFVFKFSAQQSTIEITSSIKPDIFFPELYLIKSPYQNELQLAELIINSYDSQNFEYLDSLIRDRYYFMTTRPYAFLKDSKPYYWDLRICPDIVLLDKKSEKCHREYLESESGLDIVTEYENPFYLQLANPKNKVFLSFLYAPATEDLAMEGGVP